MVEGDLGGAGGEIAVAWSRSPGKERECELASNLYLLSTYYVILGQGHRWNPTGVGRLPVRDNKPSVVSS